MCDKTIGAPAESQAASVECRLYVRRHVFINIFRVSGLQSTLMGNPFKRYDALHKMLNTKLMVFFFSEISDWFGSLPFSENRRKFVNYFANVEKMYK